MRTLSTQELPATISYILHKSSILIVQDILEQYDLNAQWMKAGNGIIHDENVIMIQTNIKS
jgi:hypothetical protein